MVLNMTRGDSPNYLVKETQRRIENEQNVNVSGKWKIYAEAIINECQNAKNGQYMEGAVKGIQERCRERGE